MLVLLLVEEQVVFSWMDRTSFMKPSCMPMVLDEFSMKNIFRDIEQSHTKQIFHFTFSCHFMSAILFGMTHLFKWLQPPVKYIA